jgi:nicotinamidase-related amidase
LHLIAGAAGEALADDGRRTARPAKLRVTTMREKLRPMSFAERVDPASTALVVVDVQNDFCHEDGLCGRLGDDVAVTRPMIRSIGRLLDAARDSKTFIVFVRTSYDAPVLSAALAEQYERRGFANSVCLEGTMGVDFVEDVGPTARPNETVVHKHRYSAFWGSNIDLVLRANGIRTVVLTGISTDICVESTARDAFFRDFYIVVAADAVSNFSKPRHDATLAVLGRAFGDVVPSEEIENAWKGAGKGRRNWQDAAKAVRLPATLADRLRPPGVALALADLQNDVCSDEGRLAQAGLALSAIHSRLPLIAALLAEAREARLPVIHIRSEYGAGTWNAGAPGMAEAGGPRAQLRCVSAGDFAWAGLGGEIPPGLCAPGTPGAEFLAGFEPEAGEHVVVKNRFSGFVDTSLELLLRANGIRTIVLAGVTTTCAIDGTARDAAMRDYLPVVVRNCVADVDERAALHEAALKLLEATYARVVEVSEILPLWEQARLGRRPTERRGSGGRLSG